MNHKRCSARFLAITLAVLPAAGWSSTALAQFRVGDDGHANDANNRIDSGGYNSNNSYNAPSPGVTNDQIYTRHVTGLAYFHGPVGYRDPNVLNAPSATAHLDRFLAITAPVNYAERYTGQPSYQPFYVAKTLTVQPPPGSFTQLPGGGGLIPAQQYSYNPADTRLGIVNFKELQTNTLPRPGELDLPGPVDPSGYQGVMTASPLYGIRPWSVTNPADMFFISQFTNYRPDSATDRLKLNDIALQHMRNELQKVISPDQSGTSSDASNSNGSNTTAGNGQGAITDQLPSPQVGAPLEGPRNPQLSNTAIAANVGPAGQAGNLGTEQSLRDQVLVLPIAPGAQSPQLLELQRRWQQVRQQGLSTTLTDQQSSQLYNEQIRLQRQAEGEAAKTRTANNGGNGPENIAGSGMTTTGPTTLPTTVAGRLPTTAPMPNIITGPLAVNPGDVPVITSLATGVRAKGLADLLSKAEEMMRQGKFNAALDQYDAAEQVAPNHPMAGLGRAIAELGAAYYGRAAVDLRAALSTSPELLLGRYDLRGFLGQDRLQFVTKDLNEIAAKEGTQAPPVFLLAFIAHNTGDDQAAKKFLNEWAARGGQVDPLLQEVRRDWGL